MWLEGIGRCGVKDEFILYAVKIDGHEAGKTNTGFAYCYGSPARFFKN